VKEHHAGGRAVCILLFYFFLVLCCIVLSIRILFRFSSYLPWFLSTGLFNFLYCLRTILQSVLNQGFLLVKLKSSLRKFYGRHHDLVDCYGISMSQFAVLYRPSLPMSRCRSRHEADLYVSVVSFISSSMGYM
jgi:hypothetical protein